MKAKMVSINTEAVKRALEASGKTARNASLSMGRSESYLFAAMKNGKITQAMLPVLAAALDVPQKRLLREEPAKPQEAPKELPEEVPAGYWTSIDVKPEVLHMTLMFGTEQVYSVYSKIKGNTELDLMQAISYAAHMMYKLAEQEVLKKQE